jgi:hypothetical protein
MEILYNILVDMDNFFRHYFKNLLTFLERPQTNSPTSGPPLRPTTSPLSSSGNSNNNNSNSSIPSRPTSVPSSLNSSGSYSSTKSLLPHQMTPSLNSSSMLYQETSSIFNFLIF